MTGVHCNSLLSDRYLAIVRGCQNKGRLTILPLLDALWDICSWFFPRCLFICFCIYIFFLILFNQR